jgi:predicted metal-dependent phosphoesterase TrpH
MIKVDVHAHTSDDPFDRIPHTATELIDRAASLGYGALAITLHELQLDIQDLRAYANERGVVLIPGVERSIQGRHVLLLNFREGTESVDTFDDLARLKQRHRGQPVLVVAPHPYFPAPTCLWTLLDRHADLFDAVEYNAMYTRSVNFNRRAEQWAARQGKPVIGNGDIHRLRQLGTTYSLVDAPPDADAICAAMAAGKVVVESRPLAWMEVASIMADLFICPTRAGRPARPTSDSGSTDISLLQGI